MCLLMVVLHRLLWRGDGYSFEIGSEGARGREGDVSGSHIGCELTCNHIFTTSFRLLYYKKSQPSLKSYFI